MKIGYARVSTDQQNLDRQLDMLNEYGCEKIITEKYTGTKSDRDGLKALQEVARAGDTIVVESLSRLGRKTLDILALVEQFHDEGITFVSLKENFDTSTPTGKAMFSMMAVISQLERDLTVQRINEGLASAKKRGKRLGRPKVDKNKLEQAIKYHESNNYSIKEIEKLTGISKATMYRELNKREAMKQKNEG